MLYICIAFFCLSLTALLGYRVVKQEIQKTIIKQTNSTLSANLAMLRSWKQEKLTDVLVLSENTTIRNNILSLTEKSNGQDWAKEKILDTPEAKLLRRELGNASKEYGFIGFVIYDSTGYQTLALLDAATGKRPSNPRSDFVQRALNGQQVMSHPFMSEIPLKDSNGKLHDRFPTMFFATPVYNKSGQATAVLAFRIRPEIDFNNILSLNRFGESGENYVFDENGTLLTQSRFENFLKSIGTLDDSPSSTSMLNVQIRDPGGDLTQGFTSSTPMSEWSLTRMASEATQGRAGHDVDGYNDYRGVKVVGAWDWAADMQIGITTELDFVEAYIPLHKLQKIFFLIFSLLTLSVIWSLWMIFHQQKTQEKFIHQTQTLNEKERLLHTLVDNVVDSVITINQQGIVQSFNPASERLFGYSVEEVVGQNVKILMEGENKKHHDEYLSSYIRTRNPKIIGIGREVIGKRKDGSLFHLDLSVSEGKVGNESWFTGICRDITERKKMEDKMQLARKDAESANLAKSEFLASMSHELRTPLNSILGFSQLMEMDPDKTETQTKVLEHILKSSRHLLDLINDVLDLAKIETGNLSITIEPIEIYAITEQLILLTQSMATERDIRVENIIPRDFSGTVMGDRTRVKQILLNLITNAIKYNKKNGSVTLICDTSKKDMIGISVADTGPGISATHQNKLFKPFERLGAEQTTTEGTGIGLAICKDLAEKMNGSVEYETQENKGSRFTLYLPIAQSSDLQTTPTRDDTKEFVSMLTNKHGTILYIEDNLSNQKLVQEILIHFNSLSLSISDTGEEGLKMALDLKPDLILLDIDLPDIHGFEVFKRLRSQEETKNIPIIALSANAMSNEIKNAAKLGFNDYIVKPFELLFFFETISRHLPDQQETKI
ncbi:MAG: PAS domain S-box protein [Candidatus Nitrohelix vancouverensis]|uniref:Sensor protein FixL n=1 Tax=Candidatus Nitrohelix vancouverensis TaxID=2705534 RepID=A0A7T0C514_9BACT|nr:MAG: PAS domain S-box protein [Candidatus Nitrohelix vancouverensis]